MESSKKNRPFHLVFFTPVPFKKRIQRYLPTEITIKKLWGREAEVWKTYYPGAVFLRPRAVYPFQRDEWICENRTCAIICRQTKKESVLSWIPPLHLLYIFTYCEGCSRNYFLMSGWNLSIPLHTVIYQFLFTRLFINSSSHGNLSIPLHMKIYQFLFTRKFINSSSHGNLSIPLHTVIYQFLFTQSFINSISNSASAPPSPFLLLSFFSFFLCRFFYYYHSCVSWFLFTRFEHPNSKAINETLKKKKCFYNNKD